MSIASPPAPPRAKSDPAPRAKSPWPKGRRRNPQPPDWDATRRRLAKLLRSPTSRPTQPKKLRRSRHGLAAAVGVSDRTVRRWLDGRHLPAPQSARAIYRWLERITTAT